MELTRRKFVGGVGVAATGVGAGVVGLSGGQGSGPIRCEGEPTSVERSLTDESGYDDGFSYFSGNNTVRFVTTRNSTGSVSFETEPFEDWASTKCAEMGISRVREATTERLGSDEFGAGLTSSPKHTSSESVVVLNVVPTDSQTNGSENGSSVDFLQVVRVAPRSVDATVSVDGETFSRSVAVFTKQLEPATAR